MKTAISIPDPLYEQADMLASELRLSRSKLYCMALQEFIANRQKSDLTAQINRFIDANGQPTDPVFLRGSVDALKQLEW